MKEAIRILESAKERNIEWMKRIPEGAKQPYIEKNKVIDKAVKKLTVTRSSLQLKDKETPTFEVWLKDTYIKVNDSKYVHRKYKFEKDGHQVRNIYKILKDNL